MTYCKTAAVFGGALLLTALSLPAARAQMATPPATAPPATTTAPPPDVTPATAVPAPAPPPDQNTHRNRFRIGPAVGVYLPSGSKTRDRFGSSWLSIGIGLGAINPVSTKGNLALDLNLLSSTKSGNHVFFAPLGLGYRIALAPGTSTVPYAGLSVDADFSDITSNPDNVHNSFKVGAGGSAFVGVNFGDSAYLEARYYELSHANGFDLSGLNLEAGYRF